MIGGTIAPDARPRDASGFRLPEYANDRFRDDFNSPDVDGRRNTFTVGTVVNVTKWLGLVANYAQTFSPPSALQRLDGSLLAPSVANGYDLGVRLNLLDGRLVSNVSYYKSVEDNFSVGLPAGSSGNFNAIYQANAIGDTSANGRNIRGYQDIPTVVGDTARRSTSGCEFETTANLTRQLRLLVNAAVANPYQSNAYPDTIAYYASHENAFRQILAAAGVRLDPTTRIATVDTTSPSSRDAQAAANAWNGIESTFLANIITGRQRLIGSTQLTGNFFADYTLRGGKLAGLRLGAGINYRGKQVIGYRGGDTIVSPTNPNVAIDDPTVDAYTVVYSDPYYSATATLAYTWKITRDRRLGLNLRVDNLFDDAAVRYYQNSLGGSGGVTQRPKDGNVSSPARVATPTLFSYPVPLNWSLSARLDF